MIHHTGGIIDVVHAALRSQRRHRFAFRFIPSTPASTCRAYSRDVLPMLSTSLHGPAIAKLESPGVCQFGETFQSAQLVDRVQVSPTSSVLRFQLPDCTKPLQLSTCACILAKAEIPTKLGHDTDVVIRPYTPISTNALIGYMDLLVKNYQDQGTMSKFLHQIEVGSTSISFKHIPINVKIQAPFRQKHIVMIAGGTGITPMIQALHSILGMEQISMDQKVTLLYGSQHSQDILAQTLLDEWATMYSEKLEVIHILSDEPIGSSWNGRQGRIDQQFLERYLPSPTVGNDVIVLVCGPPPMYDALCGPREEPSTISGILADMGFSNKQVYKF